MLPESISLTAAFVIGLLGASHCFGMCGGVAATVGVTTSNKRVLMIFAYNLGRILSYATAGLAFALISTPLKTPEVMLALRTLAGLLLIAMGLYLAGWNNWLTKLEQQGQYIWRFVQPLAKSLLPAQSVGQAFLLGGIWGWLPCGLVYSTLIWSSAASDPIQSALLMAAFGAGTLPMMISTGIFAREIKRWLQRSAFRAISGLIVVLFGLYTIPWKGLFA